MTILLLIVMSIMYVHYLSVATDGTLMPSNVAKLILFLVPFYLSILIPVSLYLSIILVLGRLFADNELFVMLNAGMSAARLIKIALGPGMVSVILVSLLVFYINPIMSQWRENLTSKGMNSTLDMVSPGHFIPLSDNNSVLYVNKSQNQQHQHTNNIFFYQRMKNGQDQIVTAPAGYSSHHAHHTQHQITLTKGHQYKITPGKMDIQRIDFDTYTQNIQLYSGLSLNRSLESMSFIALWHIQTLEASTELAWRLSMPIMVFILTLLAIAVCYLRPKESRFAKVIPAFLLYVTYFLGLVLAKNWLSQGLTPAWLGLWWVHGVFLSTALIWIMLRERILDQLFWQRRRQ